MRTKLQGHLSWYLTHYCRISSFDTEGPGGLCHPGRHRRGQDGHRLPDNGARFHRVRLEETVDRKAVRDRLALQGGTGDFP